ncbi:extracellular solute-binding protein [Candidatus Poriferisodalis sp.]|uniref:extracellular solute-binding protein n=1 Tax=Candidatus Poriferisodalis sp. TaxID=3101277 RepID=UPI003B58B977
MPTPCLGRYTSLRRSPKRRPARLVSAVALAVALAVSACSGSGTPRTLDGAAARIYGGECAPDSGREIIVYSGRTENLIRPVLDAFACEAGVGVAVRWGSSTDLALLLAEEGDRTAADVFLSRSPGPVGFLESQGLLGTIDQEVLELVELQNHSASGTWVGFSGRKRVLVYNVDSYVPEELPRSVFDLTDERFRGQVAIPATNGSFVDWFTVFRDQYGSDVAAQWLSDMVDNNARYYPNNRSIVEAAGRGEIEMGLVNHYYQYQEAAAEGDSHRAANWDLADDDIGSLLIITAATVTASSDKNDEATELLTYLLSEPAQRYFSQETFEYPLAAGVQPVDILPPLRALEIGSVDFDALGGGFAETTAIVEASGILNQ